MLKNIGNFYKGDLPDFDVKVDTNNDMIIFEGKQLELSINDLEELLINAKKECGL